MAFVSRQQEADIQEGSNQEQRKELHSVQRSTAAGERGAQVLLCVLSPGSVPAVSAQCLLTHTASEGCGKCK